jgi:hypothetical protein
VSWLWGAGIKRGITHGVSDDIGYQAAEDITTGYDLHATILHLLGIDHERLSVRTNGVDRRLTDVLGMWCGRWCGRCWRDSPPCPTVRLSWHRSIPTFPGGQELSMRKLPKRASVIVPQVMLIRKICINATESRLC